MKQIVRLKQYVEEYSLVNYSMGSINILQFIKDY